MTAVSDLSATGNILVVDDTPANLQVLTGMLKQQGYRVRPAPSGKLALQGARGEPPDLILLDITMPEMNGYEVCEQLKADERLKEIPVIFISALTETLDKVKAFSVGGVDYITKPFQMEEVIARVETHLKLHRLQTALARYSHHLEDTNRVIGRYVSEQVQEAILNKEIPVEGELKKATVVFMDIREFTGLSEKLGPEGTILFLNDYFSRMVDVILSGGGSIDKFIGDAIMAVFGAPISADDDAHRAVRSAINLVAALEAFNGERRAAGLDEIRAGIGLHTGDVIAGNIGTPRRMEYTVVGDTVNLASRIQSLTAFYKMPIIITDATLREIRGSGIRTREIDSVRVKGRRQPVVVYEVYEHFPSDRMEVMDRLQPVFLQGLSFYKMSRFGEAIAIFEEALSIDGGDRLSGVYLERCRNYLEHPPDSNWDGVFEGRTYTSV